MVRSTLCYIENNERYLMLYRNRKDNDMNAGKWLGLGGKIEAGESPEDCVAREVTEECGLRDLEYTYRGLVHFKDNTAYEEDMYLFTAESDATDVTQCDEGELRWINKDEILNLNLWEGDKHFLKKLLSDESHFEMTLRYEGEKCVEW